MPLTKKEKKLPRKDRKMLKKMDKDIKKYKKQAKKKELKALPRKDRKILKKMDRDIKKYKRQDKRAAKKKDRIAKKENKAFGGLRKRIVKSTVKGKKVKTKYNKDGTIKKIVTRGGGKRRVVKKKRDTRKTILNKLRNLRDAKKAKKKGFNLSEFKSIRLRREKMKIKKKK